MKLDLMQTYQTLSLIQEFESHIADLKKERADFLVKGIVNEKRLKKWFIGSVIGLTLLFLSLSLVFHGIRVSAFLLIFLYVIEALKWSIVGLLVVLIYNKYKKVANQAKLKSQSFEDDLDYYETNIRAFQKALTFSVVPMEHQKLEVVKEMMKREQNS